MKSVSCPVKLKIGNQMVGYVKSVEYTRPAVEVPAIDGFRQYTPGDEIVLTVELEPPIKLVERWRLVEPREEVRLTDEWYSILEESWHPLSRYYDTLNGKYCAMNEVFRRKVLVLE